MSLRTLPRLLFRGAPGAVCLAVLILANPAANAQQPTSRAVSDATLQLFEAVMEQNLARVQAAVTEGADISSENSWGLTATEMAIDKGYFEIAHYLLSVRNFQQANVDRRRSPPRRDLGYAQPSESATAEPPAIQRFLGTQTPVTAGLGSQQNPTAPQPTPRQTTTRPATNPPPSPVTAPSPPPPSPPTPSMATAATRSGVVISRVGAEAKDQPSAPAPPPSAQTAALPAKGAARDGDSKDEPNALSRVWSKLTDAFSFGGEEKSAPDVPPTSVAVPSAAPKPPIPTAAPAPTESAAAPSQPALAAEAVDQGPALPEPGAAVPRLPRPEGTAQAPAAASEAPSKGAPSMATAAPSSPRRERAEAAARAMNSLPRPPKPPVAAARQAALDASPKAAPEPASPSADAPRPEAPERAVAAAATPEPRPDQRQAASIPETRSPVPAKELQFAMTKPGAPAADAPRPAPAAPESVQTAAAPAEPAPATSVPPRPVDQSARAAAPEAEAAPEPGLLSRVWSTVTDSLGLGDPEKTDQRQETAPQSPAADASSPPPPAEQTRLAAVDPAIPPENEQPGPVTPLISPHLKGVALTLGTSLRLGQDLGPAESAKARCVAKNFWNAHFCLEPIAWPQSLAQIFDINTILYKGKQVIVRYDKDKATRFYTLFPTESFAAVAAHFRERFGPPTAEPRRVVAEFGAPRRGNPTVQWTSATPPSQDIHVHEVRTCDDASGVLPNFDLGVVELYRSGAPDIFGHLYTSDLMILRMKQSSAKKFKSDSAKR